MKKAIILASLMSYLLSTGFDTEDGAPIRQGVHVEWYRTVVPGNAGEAIFVWSDTRYGMRNIFAHKIDQDGQLLWGDNGAVVTNLPGRQEDPVAITDGLGGMFVAWVDYRFDEQGDIFFQHLNSDGQTLMDEDGVALAQVEGKQITINMCTDSVGGVFVTWQDKRSGIDDDIYGTHISSFHDIVAPGTGVPIVVEGGNQNAKTIEYAGNSDAFIAWADFREGANADIYGQRLNSSMESLFQENGISIAATDEQELKPRATFVLGSTSFIAWKEGDESSKVLYQFIDENGLIFESAIGITDSEALQTAPRVKRSSSGDIFVNWKDLRDDPIDGDQYFQKVDSNGNKQWGDGVRIDPVEDIDFSARFSASLDGGLNVIWERGTFPDVNILFQNINSNGGYGLGEPVFISNASGYQFSPILVGTNQGMTFGIYGDQGTGSIDLKVQKIGSDYTLQWDDNGVTAMSGLDGDVNYTSAYRVSERDLYLIWEDNRASKKIYGSRVIDLEIQDTNGKKMTFGDNSSSETDFSTPYIINTSSGIYTATFDGSSSPKFIRINRLNESLNNVWNQGGIGLNAVFDMRSVLLTETSDGVGCFWSESRGFNYDIYYQKIDLDGNMTLNSEGVELVDSSGDDYVMAVIPTPDNKFMIFWMEDAWPAASLKFSKIDDQGNIEIGWNPNGNTLSSSSSDSRHLQVSALNDGSGLFALWIQDGNFSDIYAQFIDWDGNVLWDEGGVPIVEAENDQVNVTFQFNQTGSHVLIAWQDYRNGSDFDIYGEILDLNTGLTGQNGVLQFTSDTTDQYNPKMTSVQDDEFLIIWEDERGYYNADPLLINGVDLYGSGYIIGQGITTEVDGIPICIAYHKQQNVNITHHSDDEYILDWIDFRSSGKEDLANYYGRTLMKAELLSASSCSDCEPLPDEFLLKSAYPNPFNGKINFDFEMPYKQAVEFQIFDIRGNLVFDRLILPGFGGLHHISWDAKDMRGQDMASGIYLYKFQVNKYNYSGKVTYLK
ncbi:MAG: T9SS type A sorting domain-containing protein [Candidatus Neomarinimicrobiota bacterium]